MPKTAKKKPSNAKAPQSSPHILEEIKNGYEIEKRWILMDSGEDFTTQKNALSLYDRVLQNGVPIIQGYLIDSGAELFMEIGVELEKSPSTVRLRKFGDDYILTTKTKELEDSRKMVIEREWRISRELFHKYWPLTANNRVTKKRLETKLKKRPVTLDAFTDRFLLMAEVEVNSAEEIFDLPDYGKDVTGDPLYSNKAISKPYSYSSNI